MNDKWLTELFNTAKNGHYEALGKAVFEVDDAVDILKLARYMAAWHGYEDTHAILDSWVGELEDDE